MLVAMLLAGPAAGHAIAASSGAQGHITRAADVDTTKVGAWHRHPSLGNVVAKQSCGAGGPLDVGVDRVIGGDCREDVAAGERREAHAAVDAACEHRLA